MGQGKKRHVEKKIPLAGNKGGEEKICTGKLKKSV